MIGDTPRDVDCARHFGMRSIVVATGPYSIEDLASHRPDAALESLSDLDAVLSALR